MEVSVTGGAGGGVDNGVAVTVDDAAGFHVEVSERTDPLSLLLTHPHPHLPTRTYSPTRPHTYLPCHPPTYPLTHSAHARTHPLTHPPTAAPIAASLRQWLGNQPLRLSKAIQSMVRLLYWCRHRLRQYYSRRSRIGRYGTYVVLK